MSDDGKSPAPIRLEGLPDRGVWDTGRSLCHGKEHPVSSLTVKTRDGQTVDLSKPENLRRGMVFRRGERTLTVAGVSTIGTVLMVTLMDDAGRGAVADTSWPSCLLSDWVKYYPGDRVIDTAETVAFLGCDPTKATDRADCERFGIVPESDATEHGFARLREYGALDFRKIGQELPPGAVFTDDSAPNVRHLFRFGGSSLGTIRHFIGLDSRYASEQQMQRLCCGATRDCDVCTLSIGGHEWHADLATGATWKRAIKDSGAADLAPAPMPDDDMPRAPGTVVRIGGVTRDVGPMTKETLAAVAKTSAKWSQAQRNSYAFPETYEGILPDGRVALLIVANHSLQSIDIGPVHFPDEPPERAGINPMEIFLSERGASYFGDHAKTGSISDAMGHRMHRTTKHDADANVFQWSTDLDAQCGSPPESAMSGIAAAIAAVPVGCDAGGWANVVRAIAADHYERGQCPRDISGWRDHLPHARRLVPLYAGLRRDGYSAQSSVRMLLRDTPPEGVSAETWGQVIRNYCEAYEAGK